MDVAPIVLFCVAFGIHLFFLWKSAKFVAEKRSPGFPSQWGHHYWKLTPKSAKVLMICSLVVALALMLLKPVFQ